MPDKYHNEWVIRDMKIDVRIFKAQSLAFHFCLTWRMTLTIPLKC